jgi:hypothetical protein
VYSREIEGQILTLAASGWTYFSTFVLYDKETESLWFGGLDDLGTTVLTCIGGFYQDSTLPLHPHVRTLWHNWLEDHPDTKLMVE